MRVAFLTPWAIEDPRAWSGVITPMYHALSRLTEVVPVQTVDVRDALVDRVLCRLVDGRWGSYLTGHALGTAWKRGRIVSRLIARHRPDAILAVAASQDVAFLNAVAPVVQVSDTTLSAIRNYYPLFSQLNPLSSWQASAQALLSAHRVAHSLAATDWARDALIRDDGMPPDEVTVAPFGPAVQPAERPVRRPLSTPMKALMVSSDWQRKGGPTVLQCVERARSLGVAIELTVVGRTPPGLPGWVHLVPPVTQSELGTLYATSDVLIDLAHSSAAGVVLTDAAAFGLPVIARRTGGVATIVEEGQTGFLISDDDSASAGAAAALVLLADADRHAAMARAARVRSERLLNWDQWATSTVTTLAQVVSRAAV